MSQKCQRRTLIDGNAVYCPLTPGNVVSALLVEGSTFRSELQPSGVYLPSPVFLA